ncbi:hypothetical protein FNL56_21450 [Tardiphaga sp. vice304]|uniref:hypothetical protein n=1 Tax=Tardiphaga sp. vice304 TaxID=2592817 RepID=UPI00116388C2|nr:hypothetical protein [Tardiphaga sp. vice304]QDM28389.1 hypothetical protein FNL56_21450 [Tardiphaga sp. vice304]
MTATMTLATRRYNLDGYPCVETVRRTANGLTLLQSFGGHPQETDCETSYTADKYFAWLLEAPQQITRH